MQPTHPIRLVMVLNVSVFYYKTLNRIITCYNGSSSGCIPQIQFSTEKTLTRIKNPSPPPSLGIGQARGGYVASLLPDWLGLTRDLSCCVYVMYILNFLFLYTEYIELHTHTHVYSLATYCRHTGDPKTKKTNESRLN